jgi:SAM-dependent methyltransferase
MSRGVDGLTIEDLRSSRDLWWDEQFTRTMLDAIPGGARTLVEIGCGLARAALELLPHRPTMRYVGVDIDARRLVAAHSELTASPVGLRADLLRAAGERLPLLDGAADVVLTSMTLQHVLDVDVVLREARRVLVAGGTLVAVEPDMLGHRFYFNGSLDDITSAFAALYADRRAARLPADMTIGPSLPSLVREAGFRDVTARVECVQGSAYKRTGAVADELLELVDVVAATSDAPCDDRVAACKAAVNGWARRVGHDAMGHNAWFVPVFVTRGTR